MKMNQFNIGLVALGMLGAVSLDGDVAQASIACGFINKFDTVNASSDVRHDFKIELEDIHATDSHEQVFKTLF
jgi:hypothetical protein